MLKQKAHCCLFRCQLVFHRQSTGLFTENFSSNFIFWFLVQTVMQQSRRPATALQHSWLACGNRKKPPKGLCITLRAAMLASLVTDWTMHVTIPTTHTVTLSLSLSHTQVAFEIVTFCFRKHLSLLVTCWTKTIVCLCIMCLSMSLGRFSLFFFLVCVLSCAWFSVLFFPFAVCSFVLRASLNS